MDKFTQPVVLDVTSKIFVLAVEHFKKVDVLEDAKPLLNNLDMKTMLAEATDNVTRKLYSSLFTVTSDEEMTTELVNHAQEVFAKYFLAKVFEINTNKDDYIDAVASGQKVMVAFGKCVERFTSFFKRDDIVKLIFDLSIIYKFYDIEQRERGDKNSPRWTK